MSRRCANRPWPKTRRTLWQASDSPGPDPRIPGFQTEQNMKDVTTYDSIFIITYFTREDLNMEDHCMHAFIHSFIHSFYRSVQLQMQTIPRWDKLHAVRCLPPFPTWDDMRSIHRKGACITYRASSGSITRWLAVSSSIRRHSRALQSSGFASKHHRMRVYSCLLYL